MADVAAATRAIAERAARLDPQIATTAFMKEDRGGKVFIDATRVGLGLGRLRVQPAGAARHARLVSRRAGTTSTPSRRASSPSIPPSGTSAIATRGPSSMPPPQPLSASLIEEGASIPGGRVQAMHEGKRRARSAAQEAIGAWRTRAVAIVADR